MDLPLTRRAVHFQYGAAVVVGLGAMTSGAWLTWASKAVPLLRDGKVCCNVTNDELSWVVALMDLGNFLSPIPASYLMDWLGRKTILYSTAVLYLLASLFVFVANNVWYIYFARIFAGLGKGIVFAIVPIYLAEVANVQIRGALSTMFIGFLNLGMFFDFFLGWLATYTEVNIANVVIPVLFAVSFCFVPESPYYLTMKKKDKKAIKSLAKFRQLGLDSEVLLQEYDNVKATVTRDMANKNRFMDVAGTKTNRRALLIISLLAIFQRASGISPALAYMTVTLPKTGGGASIEAYLVIFSFILVAANYLATPLIDNWGRKTLLIYSSLSTAVVQLVSGVFYLLKASEYDVEAWNWLPYACIIIFGITYSLGIGFIPSTLVGELFPQNVKSYASSISAILLAITSFGVNKVFLHCPVHYMYFFFTFACILSTIFCIFFVLETKGKTFAQIQDELRKLSGEDESP